MERTDQFEAVKYSAPDDGFIYVLYIQTPETTAGYAVSASRRNKRHERTLKEVKCPYCPVTLMSVGRDIVCKLYRVSKGKISEPIQGLEFRTCSVCSGMVGVVMR